MRIQTLREQRLGAKVIMAAYPDKGWALSTVKICQRVDRAKRTRTRQTDRQTDSRPYHTVLTDSSLTRTRQTETTTLGCCRVKQCPTYSRQLTVVYSDNNNNESFLDITTIIKVPSRSVWMTMHTNTATQWVHRYLQLVSLLLPSHQRSLIVVIVLVVRAECVSQTA